MIPSKPEKIIYFVEGVGVRKDCLALLLLLLAEVVAAYQFIYYLVHLR